MVLPLALACLLSLVSSTATAQYQPAPAQASPLSATSAEQKNANANDYVAAKRAYQAKYRAQLLRAQQEQGAPAGFADQAYQDLTRYLDDTEAKSYGPGMPAPKRVAPAAFQSPPRTHQVVTQPVAMTRPPVHVAPNAMSTPPVPNRAPNAQTAMQQRPRHAANARLQDRIVSLVRPKSKQANTGRKVPSAYRPMAKLPTNQRRQSITRTTNRPTVATKQQPLFVPETSRIPATAANAIGTGLPSVPKRGTQLTQLPEELPTVGRVTTAALNQPTEAPVLAGPQDFGTPQPSFSAPNFVSPPADIPSRSPMAGNLKSLKAPNSRLSAQTTQPLVSTQREMPVQQPNFGASSQPNMVGAQGSYAQPEQRSILISNKSVRGIQENDGNAFSPGNTQRLPLASPNPTTPNIADSGTPPTEDNTAGVTPGAADQGTVVPQDDDRRPSEMDRMLQERRRTVDNGDDDVREPLDNCDELRARLLGGSIREIALDISPPASRIRDQFVAISRTWTDRSSNVVATGTMVDLRRGYVIIQTDTGLQKIPYAKLSDADWRAVSEYWRIPELCGVGTTAASQRAWVPQTVTWHASALCHKPLYFENRQLERYGHSHGPVLQPIQSTAHFFVSLFSLPYQTAIHPPSECMYALGYYRPGNCAPWLKDPVPISLDGLRRQALVTTAIAFIP